MQVIERVRDAIVSGEFVPGARLIEKVLCDRYGVSRTVIREALRHLEAEGLVTMVPNRGPVVADASKDDVQGLFEVRAVLESLAGRLFAERASATETEQLIEALAAVEAAVESAPMEELIDAKTAFTEAFMRGTHNEPLVGTLASIVSRLSTVRDATYKAYARHPDNVRQLQAIVQAAAIDRDAERAAFLCGSHVRLAAAVAASLPASSESSPQA